MRFDIQPYGGALPITFGMHQRDVHSILGPPETSIPIWNKSGFAEHYVGGRYNIGYDNGWIVKHLGFGPASVELGIRGQMIWTLNDQPDPNPILLALDPEPLERVGFWIFVRIGVTTTGYHDDDPGQLAITVFPRNGSWGELLTKAKPADTTKYRPK